MCQRFRFFRTSLLRPKIQIVLVLFVVASFFALNGLLQSPNVAQPITLVSPPTRHPTYPPTKKPTNPPTDPPTDPPTNQPTNQPTNPPTDPPTNPPTNSPTNAPTNVLTPTNPPTNQPTKAPVPAPAPIYEPPLPPSQSVDGRFSSQTWNLNVWRRRHEEWLEDSTLFRNTSSIGATNATVPHANKKYFKEKWIHFDSRWAKNISSAEKQKSLRLIWNNWADFSHQNDILYWLSHGTLLGWSFNQRLLPWDSDLDLQTTFHELSTKMLLLNQTIYHGSSNRTYFFDVNPQIFYRLYNRTDMNRIDARFIDMTDGLYIDFTGLSENVTKKKVHDKSPHYYDFEDIFPLKSTVYEEKVTWVPNRVWRCLQQEYGPKVANLKFASYLFDLRLMNWRQFNPPLKGMINIPPVNESLIYEIVGSKRNVTYLEPQYTPPPTAPPPKQPTAPPTAPPTAVPVPKP